MEAMIDAGEEWMIPLLDFRDWLASTQNPEVKPLQRDYKSRDGRVKITADGRLRYRTYTLDFSKDMLRRLLHTQMQVQKHDRDNILISEDELQEIRRLWLVERQDWEDSLPRIYTEVTGSTLAWNQSDVALSGAVEANILKAIAAENNVPVNLMQKLLDTEWQHLGMHRRASIHTSIDRILREDWRTIEQVQAEMLSRERSTNLSAEGNL
jgi:DNA sulfur modification protein DndC